MRRFLPRPRFTSPRRAAAWLAILAAATTAAAPARADAPARAALPVADARAVDRRFVSLAPTATNGATVVVFYSTECPISNAFSPTLAALAEAHAADPLAVVGICVDADLPAEDVAKHAREFHLNFPVVQDRDGSITARFAAKVTPEVFVYDASKQLRYRGRIDDQYAARGKRNAHHQTNDLRDAVDAVIAGRLVAVAAADAVGCPVPTPPDAPARPTYARDVAPVLRTNCVQCHRPGQVGPFPLETYEQARKRAHDIASVTAERLMPPWKPAADFGPALKHSKALTGDEVEADAVEQPSSGHGHGQVVHAQHSATPRAGGCPDPNCKRFASTTAHAATSALGELGGVEADPGGHGEVQGLGPPAHRDAHPVVGQRGQLVVQPAGLVAHQPQHRPGQQPVVPGLVETDLAVAGRGQHRHPGGADVGQQRHQRGAADHIQVEQAARRRAHRLALEGVG